MATVNTTITFETETTFNNAANYVKRNAFNIFSCMDKTKTVYKLTDFLSIIIDRKTLSITLNSINGMFFKTNKCAIIRADGQLFFNEYDSTEGLHGLSKIYYILPNHIAWVMLNSDHTIEIHTA